MRHSTTIRQFTRQALAFSNAPAMRDRPALDLLVEAAGLSPGQRVLDVACGPGLVAIALAEAGALVSALDATPAMIERGRHLERERGKTGIRWHAGEAEALPFADGSFDATVCRFAFHHFEEPRAVLAEMCRVTTTGGRVAVCDSVCSDDPGKAAAFHRMERLRDPSTVRFLRADELAALMADADIRLDTQVGYHVPVELEGLLAASFPAPGDDARVRRLIEASVADDGLGMGTRREGRRVLLHYPALVLAGTV